MTNKLAPYLLLVMAPLGFYSYICDQALFCDSPFISAHTGLCFLHVHQNSASESLDQPGLQYQALRSSWYVGSFEFTGYYSLLVLSK